MIQDGLTPMSIRERHPTAKIVLAHGCFDLLHAGHLALLEEAKAAGDILVVSVTGDNHVNKGLGRPVLPLVQRLAFLRALKMVDYVLPSEAEDCGAILAGLHPDVYVKGDDYEMETLLPVEKAAVSNGTRFLRVARTPDSTSKLVERIRHPRSERVSGFMRLFKMRFGMRDIEDVLSLLAETPVLIVGEQIIDLYTFVEPLAKSPRESFMSSRVLGNEQYEGGTKAVLNHLRPWVSRKSALVTNNMPIAKQRFVDKATNRKLFGAQNLPPVLLDKEERAKLPAHVARLAKRSKCVLALDYGHGFFDNTLREVLIGSGTFLAVNSQTNSANYGYNLASNWRRVDYACLDFTEYNLAVAHGWQPSSVKHLVVTKGPEGCDAGIEIPSFVTEFVDNVGAGDALFAFSGVLLASGAARELAAFVGSCAAALQCRILGNSQPIDPGALRDFIGELME